MRSGIHRFLHEIQAAKDQTLRVPLRGALDITWRCQQAAQRAGYPTLFISPLRAGGPDSLVHRHYRLVSAPPSLKDTDLSADPRAVVFVNTEYVLREFLKLSAGFKLRVVGVDLYLHFNVGAWNILPAMVITFYRPVHPAAA